MKMLKHNICREPLFQQKRVIKSWSRERKHVLYEGQEYIERKHIFLDPLLMIDGGMRTLP